MDIISQVPSAMQTVLTTIADAAAVASGCVKRKRKLTGASMVQTLVFGWLANPQSTYDELAQATGSVGIEITRQGIEQRLTQSAAEMLKTTLDASAEQVLASCPQAIPLLSRFNGVYLQDSSWITLPDELADVWPGCGANTTTSGKASLKIQLRFDLLTGAFEHLYRWFADWLRSPLRCSASPSPCQARQRMHHAQESDPNSCQRNGDGLGQPQQGASFDCCSRRA